MEKAVMVILAVFFVFALFAVVALPLALILMLCWDCVMPALFHLPTISFWQAFAMMILSSLLLHTNVSVSK